MVVPSGWNRARRSAPGDSVRRNRSTPPILFPAINTRDLRFTIKATDDQRGRISGLASVYGNIDSYGDVVMPGAFDETLQNRGGRVVVLWQHDTHQPIGKATLTDSTKGLRCDIQLELGISKARDAYAAVKAGLIDGISIGYQTIRDRVNRDGTRELHELDLWEISLVTFPANSAARIDSVRAAADALDLDPALLADTLIELRTFNAEARIERLLAQLEDD